MIQITARAFAHRLGLVATLLSVTPLAQAHPGHDGHELTWDFGHLAAHPGATLLCFGVLGAAIWSVLRATRPSLSVRHVSVKRDGEP